MSHELRTPLNAIIGFSEMLAAGYIGDLTPRQQEYADHIRQSGQHLLQLVSDILDLSRLETGRLELERSEEHTSELQSLMRISYAVFCLKKKHNHQHRRTTDGVAVNCDCKV